MPRVKIDYSKTIIYKFVCNDLNIKDIYVGATTDMIRRKAKHKSVCNCESNKSYNCKVYQLIRNNGGFNNWTMLQIENFPCNNKMESDVRERYWLELLGSNMNMKIPSRTQEEYQEVNKEVLKERQKQYYQVNNDNIKKYQEHYREVNKERQQLYKEANKEQLNKKCECLCGGNYIHQNKTHHNKSQKHLLYIISTISNDPEILNV